MNKKEFTNFLEDRFAHLLSEMDRESLSTEEKIAIINDSVSIFVQNIMNNRGIDVNDKDKVCKLVRKVANKCIERLYN